MVSGANPLNCNKSAQRRILKRMSQRGIAATTMNHRIGVPAYRRIGVSAQDAQTLNNLPRWRLENPCEIARS
jgi:hypothetical protein